MKAIIPIENISPLLLNKAKKHKVRECDEESPGSYLAYVDLGEDTYDVKLEIDEQGSPKTYSCDCTAKGKICVHIVALLLFINNKQVGTKKSKRVKKKSAHEELLATIPFDKLQSWISKLLDSNKELLIDFKQEFGTKTSELTEELIKKNMTDALKAVAGKSKKVDANQAKRIVELWKKQHLPLIEELKRNPTDANTAKLIGTIIHETYDTISLYSVTGQKMLNYASQMVSSGLENMLFLDDKTLEKALGNCFQFWMFGITPHILHIKEFKDLLSKLELSGKKIMNDCIQSYARNIKNHFFHYTEFIELAMDAASETGTLKESILHYQPVTFENNFNLKLIGQLIACKHFEKAEKMALHQISLNRYAHFDAPYRVLLSKIYGLTGRSDAKKDSVIKSLPFSFNREDYTWLMEVMDSEEEKNKLRSLLKRRALDEVRLSNPLGFEFLFWFYLNEGKSTDMLELLKIEDSLKYVVDYLVFLFEMEGMRLLHALAIASCSYNQIRMQHETNEKIIQFIQSNYTLFQIKLLRKSLGKSTFYMNYNPVFNYIQTL